MKRFKVTISPKAKRMMMGHVFFLAETSKSAGEKLKRDLIKEIKSLHTMPFRYPLVDPEDPSNPYHKMFVPKYYFTIYYVDGDHVHVDYVVDVRRDGWDKVFEIPTE